MSTDISEIKPCPFCGSTEIDTHGDDKVVGYHCLTCEAVGPNQYITYPEPREWNTRTAPKVKALRWEECGVYTLSAWTEFGNYNIDIDDGSGWAFMHECHGDAFEELYGDCQIPDDEVIDELKAAAQADYERRILSTLER